MRNKTILKVAIIMTGFIITAGFIWWFYLMVDPSDPHTYTETKETYLLKKVGNNLNDRYMLVRWNASEDTFDIIDNYYLLKENKNKFIIINKREAYFTTCETVFSLYKNDIKIDSEIFDQNSDVSFPVNYGTLENKFVRKTREEFEHILYSHNFENIESIYLYKKIAIDSDLNYIKTMENADYEICNSNMLNRIKSSKYKNELNLWKGGYLAVANLKNGSSMHLGISNYGDFLRIVGESGWYKY